ncbi:MAG: hypothetical protein JWM85_1475 [Acidimicrobiaceae bacterium]|nr:hypothetical protein [Acidimicrobiaceae bacterium]
MAQNAGASNTSFWAVFDIPATYMLQMDYLVVIYAALGVLI